MGFLLLLSICKKLPVAGSVGYEIAVWNGKRQVMRLETVAAATASTAASTAAASAAAASTAAAGRRAVDTGLPDKADTWIGNIALRKYLSQELFFRWLLRTGEGAYQEIV